MGLEIARGLAAPLELLFVRKIGVPWNPELALAAVVDGDPPDLAVNDDVVRVAGISEAELRALTERELLEIARRKEAYRADRPPLSLAGRTVIVVDDGIATGATVRAALLALRRRGPTNLVLAVPVGPAETLARLRASVDQLVCLEAPTDFGAISAYYREFPQLTDDEVRDALREANAT